jgi:enterochelin esterase family protein
MKTALLSLALLPLLSGLPALGQAPQPAGAAPQAAPVEDFKPSSVNQPGKQYPQVNSERRVRTRIVAPQATNVLLDISAVRYPLVRGADGAWIGESGPQDEGFHYYQVWIDGAAVPDPGTVYFYGSSRMGSGIEVPAKDEDFYALKNVPHGALRETFYFSKTSNSNRRIYVYTPPDYDKDPNKRYPVLYLQHGAGEDETGWGNQGRTGLIMDNLIAEGKATPFIIVMENSGGGMGGGRGGGGGRRGGAPGGAAPGGAAPAPAGAAAPAGGAPADAAGAPARGGAGGPGGRGGRGGMGGGAFERILIDELIPFIDGNYRTLADQPHRAMAGLSMGGMQTHSITMANLDKFSHIGMFSGGSIPASEVTDMAAFKQKVKLVFVSYGSREVSGGRGGRGGMGAGAKADADALKEAGVNSVYYESPLTAHEFLSWRRSLHEFAPLLFKD